MGDRPRLVRREAPRPEDARELRLLLLGHHLELGPLEGDLALEQLALAAHRDVLAGGHAEGPREETGDPGEEHEPRLTRRRAGHAHDEREVAHEAVADAEDDRPERAGLARAMPALGGAATAGVGPDRRGRVVPRCGRERRRAPLPSRTSLAARLVPREGPPDLGVLALVVRDRGDLR